MKSVLFVGNSFIYYNDLPGVVQHLSKATLECGSVTKGGSYAHQYADADSELGQKLRSTLYSRAWDCVVFQDQSFNPASDPADCLHSMQVLSSLAPDAALYFYQTWAYKEGSKKLLNTNLTYSQMHEALRQTYLKAATKNRGTIVPVGDAFALAKQVAPEIELYNADSFHPSPAGTYLAACVFCGVMLGIDPTGLENGCALDPLICTKLKQIAQTILK